VVATAGIYLDVSLPAAVLERSAQRLPVWMLFERRLTLCIMPVADRYLPCPIILC